MFDLSTLNPVRRARVELALSVEGYTYPQPRYLDLLTCGRSETFQRRDEEGRMSGCALVWCGLEWLAGNRHQILKDVYVTQRAVSDVIQIARDADALHGANRVLQPADGFVMAGSAGLHVGIWLGDDETMNGGERTGYPSGPETIKKITRIYGPHAGTLGGAKIVYVLDADALGVASDTGLA